MIRPSVEQERSELIRIADGTRVFKPAEIAVLESMLDEYFGSERPHDHRMITSLHDGVVQGFAYYALAPMTDRTWYMYWIAVEKGTHRSGIGSELLAEVEAGVRAEGGTIILIETSSMPHYEPTRNFYLKHGYEREAVVRDFYSDGDDLTVFRKRVG
jgi:ribosomal protein S18 acetylase RimI-like enzyme